MAANRSPVGRMLPNLKARMQNPSRLNSSVFSANMMDNMKASDIKLKAAMASLPHSRGAEMLQIVAFFSRIFKIK